MEVVPVEEPSPEKTKEPEKELAPFAMPPYAWAPMYEAPTPTESPATANLPAGSEAPETNRASLPLVPGISAALLALLAAGMVVLGRRSRGPKGVSAP